jgi:hypothetical protein
MNRRFASPRFVVPTLALLALAALPAAAQAFWPYGGWYGPWDGNGYHRYYSTTYNDVQPYYAVYPPVYYSPYISMRPYGASPVAWPAGMSPVTTVSRGYALAKTPTPMMVVNPYVEGAADGPGVALPEQQGRAPTKIRSLPVKIENPHVASISR